MNAEEENVFVNGKIRKETHKNGVEMGVAELTLGRSFLIRVDHNADIVKFVAELAEKREIKVATFTVVGALKRATLGFYDQTTHKYLNLPVDSPSEVASCVGNISIKDGKPFVHMHAVLADRNGNTKAGHLVEGTVFAAEVHLFELIGVKVARKHDALTDLSLWVRK